MRVPLARCRNACIGDARQARDWRRPPGGRTSGGRPTPRGVPSPFTAMPSVPPTVSVLAYLPLAVGVAAGGIAIAIGEQRQAVLGYVTYRLITVF